jgi:transposase
MRFVPTRTSEPRDLQALHRARSRLVRQRTAVTNQIRAFPLERGIPVRQGYRFLRQALPEIPGRSDEPPSPCMVRMIEGLCDGWHHLDRRVDALTDEIEALVKADADCQRLLTDPGIGPNIASAMVLAVGDGAAFARGRDFAAWLGLVPRQISTGDRTILEKISKRGNSYLRTLFTQRARVVLMRSKNWAEFSFGPWLEATSKRLHRNVLAIALANTLARIAWSALYRAHGHEPGMPARAVWPSAADRGSEHNETRRGSRDRREMEERSSRQIESLVTRVAPRSLFAQRDPICADTHRGPEQSAPIRGRIH